MLDKIYQKHIEKYENNSTFSVNINRPLSFVYQIYQIGLALRHTHLKNIVAIVGIIKKLKY